MEHLHVASGDAPMAGAPLATRLPGTPAFPGAPVLLGAPGTARKPWRFPFAAAGLTVLLALATAALVRLVNNAGLELPLFRVDAARSERLAAPAWMPPEWLADARRRIAARGSFSIFDDATVASLRAELAALPWVKAVKEVERALPRTVRLAITPRSPAAVVEAGDSLILVDEDAVVLPDATFNAADLAALPRIGRWRGEFSVPKVGKAWSDPSILDGVSVAKILPKLRAAVPGISIARIDVTNCGGKVDSRESEILLVTRDNVKLKWGRAPRTPVYGELSVEGKLANLAQVERKFPELRGVSVINLRFDEPDVFDEAGQWMPRTAETSAPADRESQR